MTQENMQERTLKLGPDGADKIAIIGSAGTSTRLGPYRDMSWAIWGCSPGVYGAIDRKDVWFETHRFEPQEPGWPQDPKAKPWFSPEYVRFMELFQGPVFMSEVVPQIPNCVLYPYAQMIAKYGPYHFTSSIAWMIALAIEQKPKAIGLWGIDMAATEEWATQRPGCQHFLGLAISLGIEIVLPPESDLLQPSTMYGLSEINPRHIKWMARLRELEARRNQAQATVANANNEMIYLNGAIENLKYCLSQWVDNDDPCIDLAVSRAAHLVCRPAVAEPTGKTWDLTKNRSVSVIHHTKEGARAAGQTVHEGTDFLNLERGPRKAFPKPVDQGQEPGTDNT